jgi:hypothetical protein
VNEKVYDKRKGMMDGNDENVDFKIRSGNIGTCLTR